MKCHEMSLKFPQHSTKLRIALPLQLISSAARETHNLFKSGFYNVNTEAMSSLPCRIVVAQMLHTEALLFTSAWLTSCATLAK